MRSKDIALVGILAALYAALVVFLAPISFMGIQFRVADVLTGTVPVLGLPAVFGLTLGVFIGNLVSPLGLIDLISAAVTFVCLLAIYLLREKSVLAGFTLYTVVISAWVAFMLYYVFSIPFLISFAELLPGVGAANIAGAYILYRILKKADLNL
ncbi:MAG: QueT transporter family protein [Candidatus Odinarchaeia archaeon]